MVHQPGTKAKTENRPRGVLYAAGGLVGFTALVSAAFVILAGVVLLPGWAGLQESRYELDRLKADISHTEKTIAAYDRFLAAAESRDAVLAKRLARSQLGVMPNNEWVAIDPDSPATLPPGILDIPREPGPQPPSALLVNAAKKLQRSTTRRGLFVIAVGCLLLAVYLFSYPGSARGTTRK